MAEYIWQALYHICNLAIYIENRARILKCLRSTGFDSKDSILPAYVAWLPRNDNPIPTRFLAPIDCLKIPAVHQLYNNFILF